MSEIIKTVYTIYEVTKLNNHLVIEDKKDYFYKCLHPNKRETYLVAVNEAYNSKQEALQAQIKKITIKNEKANIKFAKDLKKLQGQLDIV
jgi:hypothetical protein